MYLLGDNFLRGWYQIYDFEQRKVGFGKSLGSIAQIVVHPTFPTWGIVLIFISVIIVIALIAFAVIKCK
jgi:hypothetical protein